MLQLQRGKRQPSPPNVLRQRHVRNEREHTLELIRRTAGHAGRFPQLDLPGQVCFNIVYRPIHPLQPLHLIPLSRIQV